MESVQSQSENDSKNDVSNLSVGIQVFEELEEEEEVVGKMYFGPYMQKMCLNGQTWTGEETHRDWKNGKIYSTGCGY